MAEPPTIVRSYADADFERVVRRWHETNLVSYRYVDEHRRHTLADARAYFRGSVVPICSVWVAERSQLPRVDGR